MVRGSWRPNITATFWPPVLWPSALCLSRSLKLLNRRLRGPLCWVMAFFNASYQPLRTGVAFPTTSYQQLISNCPQLIRGSKSPFGLMRLSLPHLVYNSVSSNCLTSVLTELYNSSTPTWSPTPSWEWHVWSSSSGNNCHAVQRSPLFRCITLKWDLHLVPYYQPSSPARFPLITAIGMGLFLPVHHFEWHFWPGRRSKYNTHI